MVQAHHFDARDLLDQSMQVWLRRFDQVGPHLLEQVPSLVGWGFGKLLLAGRQQALEPDDNDISEQRGVNFFGATPSGILLKATDAFANGGLDFSLGFHSGDSETLARSCSTFPKSPGLTRW